MSTPPSTPPPLSTSPNSLGSSPVINLNTQQSNIMAVARVYSVNDAIGLFTGLSDGDDVQTWVKQLNNFFTTENITDDKIKISECVRHVDRKSGPARNVINRYEIFLKETSWKKFQELLLENFQTKVQKSPMEALTEFFELKWEETESDKDFLSRVELSRSSIKAAFEAQDYGGFVLHEGDLLMMATAKVYSQLTEKARPKFEKCVVNKKPIPRIFIEAMINEHNPQNANANRQLEHITTKKTVAAAEVNRRREYEARYNNYTPRNYSRNQEPEREKRDSWPKKESKSFDYTRPIDAKNEVPKFWRCFNCRNLGHDQSTCVKIAFCPKCKMSGHRMGKNGECRPPWKNDFNQQQTRKVKINQAEANWTTDDETDNDYQDCQDFQGETSEEN